MIRSTMLGAALLAAVPASAQPQAFPVKLIPGGIDKEQPDGNTIVFEDAEGLTVVDTGRHLEHQAKILDYARERGKPIVAIVNTHWHLDHSGGNQELRAVFPRARVVTSNAIRGALDGFLARGVERARARMIDPATSAEARELTRQFLDAIDHRQDLLPDVAVTGSMALGGLQLSLAPHAATEGDTLVYDPAGRTLVVGDLVVIPVPYFDTACADGWRKALDAIAALPFERLIPGHGPALDRARFETYRAAFGRLVDCAYGNDPKQACIEGWERDAAPFLTLESDRAYAREALDYYIDNNLRPLEKRREYCAAA